MITLGNSKGICKILMRAGFIDGKNILFLDISSHPFVCCFTWMFVASETTYRLEVSIVKKNL